MDDTPDTAAPADPKAHGLGHVITLYVTGIADWDIPTETEFGAALHKIFKNFSIYSGKVYGITQPECYMIKLITSMDSPELLGVLALMQETLHVSIGFEAQSNFYTIK